MNLHVKQRHISALAKLPSRVHEDVPSVASFAEAQAEGYSERGMVVWDAAPPPGVTGTVHNCTFLDAIRQASLFIATPRVVEHEALIVGPHARTIVAALPQFTPVPHDQFPRAYRPWRMKIGEIAGKDVVYAPGIDTALALLVNNTRRGVVLINIINFR